MSGRVGVACVCGGFSGWLEGWRVGGLVGWGLP